MLNYYPKFQYNSSFLSIYPFFIIKGAITKRMTAIEEMAGMDVLCSDKTGTLTLNKLTVDKNLIEVINFTMFSNNILLNFVSFIYFFF